MTTPRDQHFEATGFASLAIEEFETALQQAQEKLEEAYGSVVAAVGDSPVTEAGQNALAVTSGMHDLELPDLIRHCEFVKAELYRYGNGF